VAVIVAVAVITGSLVIGDSVRTTLVKRVDERLGKTETLIFSQYAFLNDTILENLTVEMQHVASLRGVLLSNGFVSISGKFIPVMVWGTDDMEINKGEARINNALFNEIKSSQAKEIALRLPTTGMVPLGSMFVTDTYTISLRLELDSTVSVEQGGNINLKNEQTIPFNIFLNREELAETMNIPGKINVILSSQLISKDDFASAWNYTCSGLNVKNDCNCGLDPKSPLNRAAIITSDRIFIQDKVVEMLCQTDSASNRFFSYFANSIGNHINSIPYSFITAVDYYNEQALDSDEIILSDYAAQRLNAKLGDTLSISYFVSRQFKTLTVDSVFLIVSKIVPLNELQTDKTLIADFPGLSNVERCTDWNSDLPINMKLITDKDEDYWRKYKNTPKAIVPYSALAPRWENDFGSATALYIGDTSRLNYLTYDMFGIQLLYPHEAAITAAKSGVDFSSLFLSLGFFIIISAALLMMVPLSEMLFQRRDELNLLEATGFTRKRILRLLWRESTPIVLASAVLGVIAGLAYTYLVLFLLGTVWKGATNTAGFKVYPDIITIFTGMVAGIVFSLLLLYIGIVSGLKKKLSKDKQQKVKHQKPFNTSRLIWSSILYSRKQAILSFITLASGVFILFSVGLNRQGFADNSQIRTATGGFSLWCETSVPVYHNIQTAEGRAKLGLTDLPVVDTLRTPFLQLLKYSADDASCLNLNKVVTPNVLGIDMDEFGKSDFKITQSIFTDSTVENLKKPDNSVYPALVDETVLKWSLGKNLGDTLVYMDEKGETVSILLAGTIQNSIFQGYILIDKKLFSKIWSDISGSEIMLIKAPDKEIANTKMLISQALNNYGVRVMTTGERLKIFAGVADTYLTIFLTLGGLGLLLGIFSFIIVVRKNMVARLKEITLYRSLGFDKKRIAALLYKENIIIPLYAIATGVSGSLLEISKRLNNVSIWIWMLAAIFLAIFVFCVMFFVKRQCLVLTHQNLKEKKFRKKIYLCR
jgi:putative ABC transport system permease protein